MIEFYHLTNYYIPEKLPSVLLWTDFLQMGATLSNYVGGTDKSIETGNNFLGSLPKDVFIIILSYLEYQTLILASKCNKQLYQLASEPKLYVFSSVMNFRWKQLCITKFSAFYSDSTEPKDTTWKALFEE